MYRNNNSAHQHTTVVSLQIKRFNEVADWVSSCVLSVRRVKPRAKMMTKFIKLAEVHTSLHQHHLLLFFHALQVTLHEVILY